MNDGFSRRAFLGQTLGIVGGTGALPSHLAAWTQNDVKTPASLPNLGPCVDSLLDDQNKSYLLSPRYRVALPIEAILRKVSPANDIYPAEVYCEHFLEQLKHFGSLLRESPSRAGEVALLLAPEFKGCRVQPVHEQPIRNEPPLQVFRGIPDQEPKLEGGAFADEFCSFVSEYQQILTAEFEIDRIAIESSGFSPVVQTAIHYAFVGIPKTGWRLEHKGFWDIGWRQSAKNVWQIMSWKVIEQMRNTASSPIFVDVTEMALGSAPSYSQQLRMGVDYWRAVLDEGLGISAYSNHGVSVGDIDNDGYDDFYVSQPAGLPNRLFRNNGNGTFTDITEQAGVGVLDSTSMALFADVDNDGDQDLIVITAFGPLLFLNDGKGHFQYKPNAFQFSSTPRATFTSAAMADYNRDGYLDLYLCSYGYYLGQGTYQIATPYFDANNGPGNFLFRNQGDGTFVDVTVPSGMGQNNRRFSFAGAWCDYNQDGWADLFVANDFGRQNLYRNNGDGTFTEVAAQAGVEDLGPGMSAAWLDFDGDGRPDLYVGHMWEAPGLRLTEQPEFQPSAPLEVREKFRRQATGNSLFRNRGDGTFEDVSSKAGVRRGLWGWCADAVDLDNDSYEDLYITNGLFTFADTDDLSSFFWRQVVAHSPVDATRSSYYEAAWTALTQLVHEDHTMSGRQRNVCFLNNRDGTFSDVSGATGLDFLIDGRAFALADFDHDGDYDMVLNSRTDPGLIVIRNDFGGGNTSVSFRLRGRKSNRDAVGAVVSVHIPGGSFSKEVRVGSGAFSQHSKELLFGLGSAKVIDKVKIRWPNGETQELSEVPVNSRITVEEGEREFAVEPFRRLASEPRPLGKPALESSAQQNPATWLVEPFPIRNFVLSDLGGNRHRLADFRGAPLLMSLWAMWSPPSRTQLCQLQGFQKQLKEAGLTVVAIAVGEGNNQEAVQRFANCLGLKLTILLADSDTVGECNILKKYLFDRRVDMQIPTSFLLNSEGAIERIYQGPVAVEQILHDFSNLPLTPQRRLTLAVPFGGRFYATMPRRNYFKLGVAFSERGFVDSAITCMQESSRVTPSDPATHYNLGTLYLKKGHLDRAGECFQQVLKLKKDYPEAHNNLGIVFARQERLPEAIAEFEAALKAWPGYSEAASNLGATYGRVGKNEQALRMFRTALSSDPANVEVLSNVGILYANDNDLDRAQEFFEKALEVRPDDAEVGTNLALIKAQKGDVNQAVGSLLRILDTHPDYEKTYLVLASIYVKTGERAKAMEILRRLLARDPEQPDAKLALYELTH